MFPKHSRRDSRKHSIASRTVRRTQIRRTTRQRHRKGCNALTAAIRAPASRLGERTRSRDASQFSNSPPILTEDHALEREADRIANSITAPGVLPLSWSLSHMTHAPQVLRKCVCSGSPDLDGRREECRSEQLQRKTAENGSIGTIPPIVQQVVSSPGRPLDSHIRSQLIS